MMARLLAVGILILGCIGGILACGGNQQATCPQGFYRQGDRCVNPNDPIEKYAGCIIRDSKARVATDKGTSIEAKVDTAKISASTTLEFKDKFEKSVEASTDRCVLLDVSARCYSLANNDKTPSPLPAECGTTTSVPPPTTTATGPTTPPPSAPSQPPSVRTKEFKLGRDLGVGDCLMRNNFNGDEARIYINSDGSARLRAYIRSEDSGDEFYLQVWGESRDAPTTVFQTVTLKYFTMEKSKDQLWTPGFTWSASGNRFDDLDEIKWTASGCH